MKVVIIANKLSETDPDTGQHYRLEKDDEITVSDSFGRHLCDMGWARDSSGGHEGKPFTPGVAKLEPQSMKVDPNG